MMEMVPSFRLVRSSGDDERAGRVERSELWQALTDLLAWQPDIDHAPLSAARSLVDGDAISLTRLDDLTRYIEASLVHYRQAHREATHVVVVEATARAIVNFEHAQVTLRYAVETMRDSFRTARW